MEDIEETSLRAILDVEGVLPWRRVFLILSELCPALVAHHANGDVLLTLDPEHIYLRADRVELRELELAVGGVNPNAPQPMRGSGGPRRQANKGVVLHTVPAYVSPERLMGRHLDGRSDLYALGAIAYELLTGHVPFPDVAGKGPARLVTAQLTQTPRPPSELNADVPPSVDAVVLACLETDRTKRYPDMAAFGRAVAEVLLSDAISTPTSPRAVIAAAAPRTMIDEVVSARACGTAGCTALHQVLPAPGRRTVGRWILLDHFDSLTSTRAEAPQHPHVGVATVSYLFDGRLIHRDSLGNVQTLKRGDVSWMFAGRGIVHTERRDPVDLSRAARLHGLELWLLLPKPDEDAPPAFVHHPAATLPAVVIGGVRVRIILGEGFGARSPVETPVPLTLFDVHLPAGAAVPVMAARDRVEVRSVYVVAGAVEIDGTTIEANSLAVLAPDVPVPVLAARGAPAHIIVLGSPPTSTAFHPLGTLVASTKQRLEDARQRWIDDRIGAVPGETERVTLPPT